MSAALAMSSFELPYVKGRQYLEILEIVIIHGESLSSTKFRGIHNCQFFFFCFF